MNLKQPKPVFGLRRRFAAGAPGTWLPMVFGVLLALSACDSNQIGNPLNANDDHYNVKAVWDDTTQTLKVSGKTTHDDTGVEIHDATDGSKLGAAVVNDDGSWAATASTPACKVHVSLPSGTVTKDVEGAPADCAERSDKTGKGVSSRALATTTLDATNNPEPLSTAPNGLILRPDRDVVINAGEAVEFEARAVGGTTTAAVSYSWSFGGGTQNTTVQNPGPVVFDAPGIYNVALSVVDAAGIPDPTPAIRTITVTGPNFSLSNVPVPVISSPILAGANAISVNVGDSLFFSGSANDPTGTSTFNYEWDFSGAAPPQFVATPGNVLFARAGTFRCSLNVTNQLGLRSAQPAIILVNVGTGAGNVGGLANQAPVGAITSPRRDITVKVGDSVNFEGRGRDPDNNVPLSYSWDFGGAATPVFGSPDPNGGPVRFQTPGVYAITFRVTDALGATDPNPPVRTVTVLPLTGLPPGGTLPPGNTTLSAGIISPPTNVSIQPGQSVFFSGQAPSTAINNYRYLWSFGGGATSSTALTPGNITFSIPGQYVVEFMVADLQGNIIGVPDSRIITVGGFVPPTPPPGGTPPAPATILSPADNSTIIVGTPVNLQAQAPISQGFSSLSYEWEIALRSGGTSTPVYTSNQLSPQPFAFQQPGRYRIAFRVRGMDPLGNFTLLASATNRVTVNAATGGGVGPLNGNVIAFPTQDMVVNLGSSLNFQLGAINGSNLQYQWDFGGLAQPSFQSTPPPIIFNRQGTFTVTVRITGIDFNGQVINAYGQRVITVVITGTPPPVVQPPVSGFATPDGIIDTPSNNVTVRVGQPVAFSGRGFDPTGGPYLRYQWSFGGAAPNIISPNPGTVTFTQVGSYVVSLLVINSVGIPDPNPPHVVITVVP